MIHRRTLIEDLVKLPGAVSYLMKHNIKCLTCGEPVWGTLEEVARQKGHTDADIDRFVEDLNRLKETGPEP